MDRIRSESSVCLYSDYLGPFLCPALEIRGLVEPKTPLPPVTWNHFATPNVRRLWFPCWVPAQKDYFHSFFLKVSISGGRKLLPWGEGGGWKVGWGWRGWTTWTRETWDIWNTSGTRSSPMQLASGGGASRRETDPLLSVCQLLPPTALAKREPQAALALQWWAVRQPLFTVRVSAFSEVSILVSL